MPNDPNHARTATDSFLAAWQTALDGSSEAPRIEDYLPTLSSDQERADLLTRLLSHDLTQRRQRGEQASKAEYVARFPDDQQLIEELFKDGTIVGSTTRSLNSAQIRWSQLRADLETYRDEQADTWGDIDELTMARYLAGELSDPEQLQIEDALKHYEALRESVELSQEFMAGSCVEPGQPAADATPPTTVQPKQTWSATWWRLLTKHSLPNIAVAATLLIALGLAGTALLDLHRKNEFLKNDIADLKRKSNNPTKPEDKSSEALVTNPIAPDDNNTVSLKSVFQPENSDPPRQQDPNLQTPKSPNNVAVTKPEVKEITQPIEVVRLKPTEDPDWTLITWDSETQELIEKEVTLTNTSERKVVSYQIRSKYGPLAAYRLGTDLLSALPTSDKSTHWHKLILAALADTTNPTNVRPTLPDVNGKPREHKPSPQLVTTFEKLDPSGQAAEKYRAGDPIHYDENQLADEFLPKVKLAFSDEDTVVRWAAVSFLRKHLTSVKYVNKSVRKIHLDLLEKLLQDEHPLVRRTTISAFAEFSRLMRSKSVLTNHQKQIIDILNRALTNEDPVVVHLAGYGVGLIGPAAGQFSQKLLSCLENESLFHPAGLEKLRFADNSSGHGIGFALSHICQDKADSKVAEKVRHELGLLRDHASAAVRERATATLDDIEEARSNRHIVEKDLKENSASPTAETIRRRVSRPTTTLPTKRPKVVSPDSKSVPVELSLPKPVKPQ